MEYTDANKPKRILADIEDIDEIKKYETDILKQNLVLPQSESESLLKKYL